MACVKRAITKVLSPLATATLIDPEYGYPYSFDVLPRQTALLLASEQTGHEHSGPQGRARKTRLINGWNVDKAVRAGADVIKLLLYYRPDGDTETNKHQQQLCCQVGEQCRRYDLPFLLELVAYPLEEPSTDSSQFARLKPKLVAESAVEFSKPQYQVDILKLEFPADLKYAAEYKNGDFDGKKRESIYSAAEVQQFCRQIDQASELPWVILSAGVGIK